MESQGVRQYSMQAFQFPKIPRLRWLRKYSIREPNSRITNAASSGSGPQSSTTITRAGVLWSRALPMACFKNWRRLKTVTAMVISWAESVIFGGPPNNHSRKKFVRVRNGFLLHSAQILTLGQKTVATAQ